MLYSVNRNRFRIMTATYKHYSWYNLIDYSGLSNKYTKVKNIKIPNKKLKTTKFKESRLYNRAA